MQEEPVQGVHGVQAHGEADAPPRHEDRDHDRREEDLERERPEPPDVLGALFPEQVAKRRDQVMAEVASAGSVLVARDPDRAERDREEVERQEHGHRSEPPAHLPPDDHRTGVRYRSGARIARNAGGASRRRRIVFRGTLRAPGI